jgi:tetratricopeptide (TPR) repeat protein
MVTAAQPSAAQSPVAQRYNAARAAYERGAPSEAVALLQAVIEAAPRSGPAFHLLGLSLFQLGDLDGAERAFRASVGFDKRPSVYCNLGEVLERRGRAPEAEKAYRAGLGLDRRHAPCAIGLAGLLCGLGRPLEALQVTNPLVASPDAAVGALEVHTEALKRAGRLEESLGVAERAVAAGSRFAILDIASTLRELGRNAEAEAAARRGFDIAGNHPAVWMVLGRIMQDQSRHDEAEAAYRRALELNPLDAMAHQSLAELLWARTADPEKASVPLDSVLRQKPTAALAGLKAKLLTRAGKPDEAYAFLADFTRRTPEDPILQAAAATAAIHAGRHAAGLAHAEQAASLAQGLPRISALLAECCLATGQPDRCAEIVAPLLAQRPHDQQFIAMQATAWRLMGDPRYGEVYDYDRMVGDFIIEAPKGWPTLEAYLADLAETLKSMHAMRGDPLDQSLRNGTQTDENLVLSTNPVIQAFFRQAQAPIRAYMASLGKGRDPLRSRNQGGYHVKGAWSVRLQPNGFHADHLHPEGWLSSAFYVELPKAVDENGHEGWIKFGQPGAPTQPALEAEHFVRPAPGKLVLFPSYMWHGTVPFSGDETRLTMAFDVVPGKAS